MTPRAWAFLLVVAVAAYLLLAGARGVALVSSGQVLPVALGVAVLVLPFIGAWVVWREISFGFAMQRMGRQLVAEGDLPIDDFERLPSGRMVREDAARFFSAERERVEAHPEDWRSWYRLGLAYDAGRDRRRARGAMRRARALFESN